MYSPADASPWASAWAGITRSLRRWVRILPTGASAPKSRLTCCAPCGLTRWWILTDAGTGCAPPASSPCQMQRPIPVWFGAGGTAGPVPRDVVFRRIARMGDGWFPSFGPDDHRPRRAGQNANLHCRGRSSTRRCRAGRPSADARQVARGMAGRSRKLAQPGRYSHYGRSAPRPPLLGGRTY